MGRYPKCKSCSYFSSSEGGCGQCSAYSKSVDEDTSEKCPAYLKAEPKRLSREELSIVRSRSGRKGGLVGGKRSGYGKGRSPTKTITVRERDFEVFNIMANADGQSMAETFHRLCQRFLDEHPEFRQNQNTVKNPFD